MTNVASFTYSDLQTILGTGAQHLDKSISVVGISTDTRSLVAGNCFIALRGERFDGHNSVYNALASGAVLCVVEQHFFDSAPPEIKKQLAYTPNSTLTALGSFAWHHRKRFDIPIVAIAGAAGKTSTKELSAHVLGIARTVLKTEANYNNKVGTPLTILGLTHNHDCAVIEIGTNEPGEIEYLSALVQPTHGLITNIGKEHLEKLIDLDGVEREETALFDYLNDKGGLALVNVDDERLAKYATSNGRTISFGIHKQADVFPTISFNAELRPAVSVVHGTMTFRAQLQTIGMAAAYNAVAAIAVAWALGLTADEIRLGLKSYQPPDSHGYARMVMMLVGGLRILNDTYNANPESVVMALQTLERIDTPKRIAVLGDMRELGAAAAGEHLTVLTKAAEICSTVIVLGNDFSTAADSLSNSRIVVCTSHEQCAQMVIQHTTANDTVLVKGSRSMAMENVITLLQQTSHHN